MAFAEAKRSQPMLASRGWIRGADMHDTKIARQNQVKIPAEICLRCFNMQQQFAFPFLVYCAHNEMLALFRSPQEYVTFECAPEQLKGVLHTLSKESQSGSTRIGR